MAGGSAQLRAIVAARAGYRCEYCRSPQVVTAQTFHVDHIVPLSKGGETTLENLCYACPRCNLRKKDAIWVADPETGAEIELFHPRRHIWNEHFVWSTDLLEIIGQSAVGRATVVRLQLNDNILQQARAMWTVLRLIP
ncbi:MAG: HNH endonuclease signature motif containing protein [Caldilineaceae bacterium]